MPKESSKISAVRLVLLAVLFGAQFLYFPINRMMNGGVVLATSWDRLIPFWSIWIIPYLLTYVWWAFCFVWFFLKMDFKLYKVFVISFIFIALAIYLIFIIYPTYVIRPSLEGASWSDRLVALVYNYDQANNAFPSNHVCSTVLISLFLWRWRPQKGWLWLIVAMLIILSTLFTRQHNIPDVIGGIALAFLGYWFGLWWTTQKS